MTDKPDHWPEHWNAFYAARETRDLTWFESDPETSRDLIARHLAPGEAIVDVGGGASRLTETLAARGFGPLSILDISPTVLEAVRARPAMQGLDITLIAGDVTRWRPDRPYHLWHDRAVFHFLTARDDRAAYARVMARALVPGGIAIIATFAEDGPEKCSGLPVMRYSPAQLAATLDDLAPGLFTPLESLRHRHVTPKGGAQSFQFSVFRRRG